MAASADKKFQQERGLRRNGDTRRQRPQSIAALGIPGGRRGSPRQGAHRQNRHRRRADGNGHRLRRHRALTQSYSTSSTRRSSGFGLSMNFLMQNVPRAEEPAQENERRHMPNRFAVGEVEHGLSTS